MKIALVNGPLSDNASFTREGRCTQRASIWTTQWPPVTLAYLAAIALAAGHAPRVFDCPAAVISLRELLKILSQFKPDLCVLAFSTPSIADDTMTAHSIKETLPETAIAACGVHASVLDLELLRDNPPIDYVIRGEPEESFGELIEFQRQGEGLEDIRGLSLQGQNGPRRNPSRPFIENLDRLPFPAWEKVDRDLYSLPFRRQRQLCLSPHRGCPHHCSFCTAGAYYGHSLRFRSVESVIEEICRDRRDFHVHDFFIWADTFTIKKSFVMDLAEAMRRETPGIRWTCNSRTDTVDAQMLESMSAAGCWMISFGIESTDETVQAGIGKKLGSTDFRTPIQMARNAGMKTLGHFIFGLPGETPASMKRTLKDALASDLDFAQFYSAAPFVGSSLYETAMEKNYLPENAFGGIGQATASLWLPGLPPEAVNRMRGRAMLSFYFRPNQIARVLGLAGFGIFRQMVRVALRWWKAARRS